MEAGRGPAPRLFFQAEDGIRDVAVTGVQTCALPIFPPEEASEVLRESRTAGLSNIFLMAPTTPTERIRMIDAMSTDCSYCVSVTGVTGARGEVGANGSLGGFLGRVKRSAKKPFVVGFGISTPAHVREVWRHADGAVVGSALMDVLGRSQSADAALDAAETFFRSLRGEE